MRYPASEKLEIIRTVEASHLSARQTLAMLGIPRTTYYRWYDRWSEGGLDALAPLTTCSIPLSTRFTCWRGKVPPAVVWGEDGPGRLARLSACRRC